MRLKFLPWSGLVTLVSALVAVATLPFPPTSLLDRYFQPDEPVRTAHDRLRTVQAQLQGDVREFRAAEAITRGREIAARNRDAVVIEPSVPAELRAQVDSLARAAWTRIGPGASAAHAGILVFFDSSTVQVVRHLREPNRPLEITHALPEATENGRCLTIVRMRRATTATFPRPEMLFGPCGFYAAFGAPGAGIREWLGARNFASALWADWTVEPKRADERSTMYFALDAAASACLGSGGSACREVLAIDVEQRESVRTSWHRSGNTIVMPQPPGGMAEAGLTGLDRRLLADMVREFGAERFRKFWTSSAAPDVAFRDAMGTGLEDWMRGWLREAAPAPARTAVPPSGTILWLGVALPLLTLGAVRRRELLVH